MNLIEFNSISKRYGNAFANEDVTFNIQSGCIHALVGENGAGKSTLMKVLFGLEKPDSGFVKLNDPNAVIGMVHQHFMLAGPLTALDHVVLESKKHRSYFSFLNRKALLKELVALGKQFQLEIPWTEKVENLPVGIQQRLEILKILYNKSDILILDEPTAVLTPYETEEFLNQLVKIKNQGKTILLITHKLKEVFACADFITVLRKGKVVSTKPTTAWSIESLSTAMIGKKLTDLEYSLQPQQFKKQNALVVKNLFGRINLSIEKGEVVGIAGVEGNGQSELIQALIQPEKSKHLNKDAEAQLFGSNLLVQCNKKIRSFGVGYLAEDRHHQSIVLEASVLENYLLGQEKQYTKFGFINYRNLANAIYTAIKNFEIKLDSVAQHIRYLSGGNQQKLVVARELKAELKLLIACQPTRGVDIAAIQIIHAEIMKLKKQGCAVLLVSSDLDELMRLSDRMYVLCKGEIKATFEKAEFNEKKIGAAMGGVKS